jgi:hypothetical protein
MDPAVVWKVADHRPSTIPAWGYNPSFPPQAEG